MRIQQKKELATVACSSQRVRGNGITPNRNKAQDLIPYEGRRKVWLACREVCNLSERWRLFYFDGFSFSREARGRSPDESE